MGKPKHIVGAVYNTTQGAAIIIESATEDGYDLMTRVEDLDKAFEAKPQEPKYYDGVCGHVLYIGAMVKGGVKNLRVHFQSGEFEDITVPITPPKNVESLTSRMDVDSKVNGPGGASDYSISIINRSLSTPYTASYSVMPQKDPAGVFQYDKAWKISDSGTIVRISGTEIKSIWEKGGTLNGGLPAPGVQGIQYAVFAAVVDADLDSPAEVWGAAFGPDETKVSVISFVWAKDLAAIDINGIKRFETCTDLRSPSYYKTTGTEVDGDVIPAEYLTGTKAALFAPCDCPVSCDEFKVQFAPEIPTLDDKYANFKVTVYGNEASPHFDGGTNDTAYQQANNPVYPSLGASQFQYDLIVPAGIVYPNPTTSGITNDTSWRFEDIPVGTAIWKIQATDIATGCKTTFAIDAYTESARTAGTCDQLGSLNYDAASTLPCSDCCLDCKAGYLKRGGVATGENLILNTSSNIHNSSNETSNDGEIQFSGSLNLGIDALLPSYLSGAFDISLYQTAGAGASMGALVSNAAKIPSPSYTFSGLAPGWYAVQIFSFGELCVSTYYFEVSFEEVEVPSPCAATIDYAVDPCSGQFSTTVSVSSGNPTVQHVTYTLNGAVVGSIPPTVVEGDVVGVIVEFAPQAAAACEKYVQFYDITADMLVCDNDRDEPEIHGCMDPEAVNYNPDATSSDGSCFYGVPGCMDPTASNYNPNATINNGSCIYGIPGCTDPSATNYNPQANLDDGSCFDACTDTIIDTITAVGTNEFEVIFDTAPAVYSVSWENAETGTEEVISNSPYSSTLPDGVYIVTVTTGLGCQETYILGINDTPTFGCTDPNASNFNPSANISEAYGTNPGTPGTTVGGVCTYSLAPSPCVPANLNTVLEGVARCMSEKTTDFVNMLKAGRIKNCNTHDLRVAKLLYYLLQQRGLPCLYNCADSTTPDADTETCADKWHQGGPTGGSLVYNDIIPYNWGDVVKHPVSGNIYILTSTDPDITGEDPETPSGEAFWSICKEPVEITDTTNRLDAYYAFLAKVCIGCNLPPVAGIPTEDDPVDSDNPTTMDGSPISINGPININLRR